MPRRYRRAAHRRSLRADPHLCPFRDHSDLGQQRAVCPGLRAADRSDRGQEIHHGTDRDRHGLLRRRRPCARCAAVLQGSGAARQGHWQPRQRHLPRKAQHIAGGVCHSQRRLYRGGSKRPRCDLRFSDRLCRQAWPAPARQAGLYLFDHTARRQYLSSKDR